MHSEDWFRAEGIRFQGRLTRNELRDLARNGGLATKYWQTMPKVAASTAPCGVAIGLLFVNVLRSGHSGSCSIKRNYGAPKTAATSTGGGAVAASKSRVTYHAGYKPEGCHNTPSLLFVKSMPNSVVVVD